MRKLWVVVMAAALVLGCGKRPGMEPGDNHNLGADAMVPTPDAAPTPDAGPAPDAEVFVPCEVVDDVLVEVASGLPLGRTAVTGLLGDDQGLVVLWNERPPQGGTWALRLDLLSPTGDAIAHVEPPGETLTSSRMVFFDGGLALVVLEVGGPLVYHPLDRMGAPLALPVPLVTDTDLDGPLALAAEGDDLAVVYARNDLPGVGNANALRIVRFDGNGAVSADREIRPEDDLPVGVGGLKRAYGGWAVSWSEIDTTTYERSVHFVWLDDDTTLGAGPIELDRFHQPLQGGLVPAPIAVTPAGYALAWVDPKDEHGLTDTLILQFLGGTGQPTGTVQVTLGEGTYALSALAPRGPELGPMLYRFSPGEQGEVWHLDHGGAELAPPDVFSEPAGAYSRLHNFTWTPTGFALAGELVYPGSHDDVGVVIRRCE